MGLLIFIGSGGAFAQENGAGALAPSAQEIQEYLQAIESLKDSPLEDQVEGWRNFLQAHPDTAFRFEIEKNLSSLDALLNDTNPERRKQQQDTELYMKAVKFARKLNPRDEIALWKQFIRENPDSLYKEDANARIEELEKKYRKRSSVTPTKKKERIEKKKLPDVITVGGEIPDSLTKADNADGRVPVAEDLEYRDPSTALFMASVPGLLVPAMGHWYARDYPTAVILTGVRLAGLALGIPGILNSNQTFIITGGVLAGMSYLIDVVDAPYAVHRYNENLEREAKDKQKETGWNYYPWNKPTDGFSLTWTFHY